jgi:uncharacterized membrane protein YagU involved in acid resistance
MQAEPVLLKGVLAGAVATLPMTQFMLATQQFLLKGQRYALPPEINMKELSQRTNIKLHLNKKLLQGTTLLSHFGYEATLGALYSPLARTSFLPAFVRGSLFGLGVWTTSYLGLLPLLHFRASGDREPGLRNLMMLTAHVV